MNNLEAAEAYVAGAILLDPDCMDEVAPVLTPGHFKNRDIRRVYAAALRLYNKGEPHDAVAVDTYLRMPQDKDVVADLLAGAATSANVEYYARKIRQEHVRAEGGKALKRASDLLGDCEDPAQSIEMIAADLLGLDAGTDGHALGSAEAATKVWRTSLDLADRRAAGEQVNVGWPTPWSGLNRLIGGLKPGKLHVLGADTGHGKSVAAMQCALKISSMGGRTAYFSGEMGAEEYSARLFSILTGINPQNIEEGRLDEKRHETARLTEAAPKARRLMDKIAVVYDDITPEMMRSFCRRMRRQVGVDFIVLDYLQLASAAGFRSGDQHLMYEHISSRLKRMAVEFSVPVLALSQLRRDKDREVTGKPRRDHLHGSGAFGKDADVVMMLAREPDDRWNDPDIAGPNGALSVVKGRSCRMGVADLIFDDRRLIFSDKQ